MKGRILDFNQVTGAGIISSEDGSRYNFHKDNFKSSVEISVSMMVDFIEDGESAKEIYQAVNSEKETEPTKTSVAAIVSIIAGIFGLFIFGSLIAIISGHIAKANIKKSEGKLTGNGLALTGLITGYIGIVLTILVLIAVAIPKFVATRDDANLQKLMYEKQLEKQIQEINDLEN